MANGYMGKWVDIDLNKKSAVIKDVDMDFAKTWVGGRGVGVKILYDRLKAGADPLSPDNIIVLATGPITGTGAPSSGRFVSITKSPLTNTVHDSHCGGDFGHALKAAGFDWLVITGKADKPTWIFLDDGKVEFKDASALWGKDVFETEKMLLEELDPSAKGQSMEKLTRNSIGVACIGPPGENMKRLAAIMNRFYRAVGRGGHGAVMGSKNLKAVVARGKQKVSLYDEDAYRAAVKKNEDEAMKVSDVTKPGGGLNTLGTALLVNIINGAGIYPTRNFQTGVFEGAEITSGEYLKEKRLIKPVGCKGCRIMCGRWSKIEKGPFAGTEMEGPEYENMWSWGADCGVDDIDYVMTAHHLCNLYGLDAIQAGTTTAFAMECFEKGIITTEDTGGIELTFGNADAMIKIAEQIGKVEGIGKILADGEVVAARKWGKGADKYAMVTKGQSMPAYDPRGSKGHGLAYATSNRGACHIRAYMINPEILGAPEQLPRFDPGQKTIDMLIAFQNFVALLDSSLLCLFVSFAMGNQEFANLLKPATGWNWTADMVDEVGARIWNLERMFNSREGFGRKDDTLATRMLEEPMPEGPAKGHTVPIDKLLPMYYETRGYDNEGKPTEETQKRYGLA
ncbi:MAG: aldehyde ferredoxin oxidoreductase family protein [Promethearchaeota archaeon]